MDDIAGLIREELRDLPLYESGVPWQRLAAQYGLRADQIAKLDSNENPYGPAPLVKERLAALDLEHYPDPDQVDVRRALADYIGVEPGNVVGGNGSDEMIDLVMRLFCAPGDEIVLATPTFLMYGIYAAQHGVTVKAVPRRPDDWSLDRDGLKAAVGTRTRLIFITSPNNPTANALTSDELDFVLGLGVPLVVDEAYGEFAERQVAPLVPANRHLMVLRTFSKWAGLAGVRAGYLVADSSVVEKVLVMKSPFNMSLPAQVSVLASLEQRGWLDANVAKVMAERGRLAARLAAQGPIDVWPSDANFLLCRLSGIGGREARDWLRTQGVFTRHFDIPELSECLRITVGRPEDSDRLIDALERMWDHA